MSERIEKINSLLEQEISKIIFRDFDFSPNVLVTLTRVETTANLIEAKVYISTYPEEKSAFIMSILSKAVFTIQQKINGSLKMRPIPKIIFIKETAVSRAGRIEELLAKVEDSNKVEKKP